MLLTAYPQLSVDFPPQDAGLPPGEGRLSTVGPLLGFRPADSDLTERVCGFGSTGLPDGKPARAVLRTEFGMSRYFGMDRRQPVNRLNSTMRRLAGLRTIGTIVVAGLLLGYVGAEIMTTAMSGGMLVGSAESPEAHDYLVAYLAGDSATATKYRPTDTVTKAIEIQSVERAASVREITSMTYIGGASEGRMGVYVYAVTGHATGSTNDLLVSFTLTVVDGKIVAMK
jgi:hypothetical protein